MARELRLFLLAVAGCLVILGLLGWSIESGALSSFADWCAEWWIGLGQN